MTPRCEESYHLLISILILNAVNQLRKEAQMDWVSCPRLQLKKISLVFAFIFFKTSFVLQPYGTKASTRALVLRRFSHVWLFVAPWTIACQPPLSMGFSRQEYWSGLPFPSPGDLPNPGTEPTSLTSPALAGRFFTLVPLGKPKSPSSLPLKHNISSRSFKGAQWGLGRYQIPSHLVPETLIKKPFTELRAGLLGPTRDAEVLGDQQWPEAVTIPRAKGQGVFIDYAKAFDCVDQWVNWGIKRLSNFLKDPV